MDAFGNPVSEPLYTLEQVLKWEPPSCNCRAKTLHHRVKAKQVHATSEERESSSEKVTLRSKLLVCHDMCGGYLNDRFPQGCSDPEAYTFYHWHLVDTFVYFSHHFVTIPPPGWILAAHKNGVSVLGTIITEWDNGATICKQILKSPDTIDLFTSKLAEIALFYGFDGWLINIENPIEPEDINPLQRLVAQLTDKCRISLTESTVLWYDSVVVSGQLKWQDELNSQNEMFFHACDGIYLNYNITEEKLQRSQELAAASGRQFDVYAGVDVFGRGSPGGGGFNCKEAIEMILRHGLSCALFAPGWVYEHLGKDSFHANETVFWGILGGMFTSRPLPLPFSTSFCRGYGQRFYSHGKVVRDTPWSNLCLQHCQPSYSASQFMTYTVQKVPLEDTKPPAELAVCEDNDACKFRIEVDAKPSDQCHPSMSIDVNEAYEGGACLHLTACPTERTPVCFSLFDIEVQGKEALTVKLIWKESSGSTPCRMALVLSNKSLNNGCAIVLMESELEKPMKEKIVTTVLPCSSTSEDNSAAKGDNIHFVRAQLPEVLHSSWTCSTFQTDLTQLVRDAHGTEKLSLSVLLMPAENSGLEPSTANGEGDKALSVKLGFLHVSWGCITRRNIIQASKVYPSCSPRPQEEESVVNVWHMELEPSDWPLKSQCIEEIMTHPFFTQDTSQLQALESGTHTKEVGRIYCVQKSVLTTESLIEHVEDDKCSQKEVVFSSDTAENRECPSRLHFLKWDDCSSNKFEYYSIYGYKGNDNKILLGQTVCNCFVWRQDKADPSEIDRFSIIAHYV